MESLDKLRIAISNSNIVPASLALETLFTSADVRQFRQIIPIADNPESLIDLRDSALLYTEPHPYQALGAPYGSHSPFSIRESILDKLERAQQLLSRTQAEFRLKIHDAYRPIAVQSFMIEHELAQLARQKGLVFDSLDERTRELLRTEVLRFWSPPNEDRACPPPHSTGAAIDLSIVNGAGEPLAMGSAIDHIGDEALPNYFSDDHSITGRMFVKHRELLYGVMKDSGFCRLPHEWWHFSYGDQVWALIEWLEERMPEPYALYGRV